MEDDYQKGECTKCTKHIHDTNYGYVNGLLYVLGFSFFLGGFGSKLLAQCSFVGVNLLWFMSYRVYCFLYSHIPFGDSFLCVCVSE